MKRKNLLFGTIGVAVLTTFIMFFSIGFNRESGSYKKTDLSVFAKQNATDAQKWLAARYIDAETGQKITPERLRELYMLQKSKKRADFINFEELGPDNIGGRTRGIVIDRNNNSTIYAGGVSGGLFVSHDRALTWTRDDAFIGLPYISSMTQTMDGTFFVATGTSQEGWSGSGLFYKTTGSDQWLLVPGTDVIATYSNINEVVCADNSNTVYFTSNNGLKKWTVGDAAVTPITINSPGSSQSLQISKDGSVIIVAMSGSKTYVSEDGGNSFLQRWGNAENELPTGASLIQFSISPTKNSANKYTVYASRTDGNLLGMYASLDNGINWSRFAGAADGTSNLDIYRDQGTYNSILSVDPRNTERLLIGGIDIWHWNQTTANPVYGGFEKLSDWFLEPTSERYVHADNHEMKWDNTGRLYLGNDGGVGVSEDFGESFYPSNRGYNVTQFYGIAMDRNGRVMGGAQDNGTLYNPLIFNSYKNFIEVQGGDGFECEISFFNPRVMFATIYTGALSRSGDNGFSFSGFVPEGPGINWGVMSHAFHTEFVMAEYYDENSRDSVTFFPRQNYLANSVIKVASMSTGDTVLYTTPTKLYYSAEVNHDPTLTRTDYRVTSSNNPTPIDLGKVPFSMVYDANPMGVSVNDTIFVNGSNIRVLTADSYTHYFAKSPHPINPKILDMHDQAVVAEIPWDTIQVQDPFQSWLIIHTVNGTGELFATRDALRLSKEPTWIKLASGVGNSSAVDIEFSKDLNQCFVSCGSGVYRINNLGNIYEQDYANATAFRTAVAALGTAKVKIYNPACEGIALNPTVANDLLVIHSFGGSTAVVKRTANANAATPTFTTLRPLDMPGYDAIIDRDNPEVIVVGTAFGVVASNNGADPNDANTWQDASTGFDNVPVFEVRQNWRTWEEGCTRSGEIYLGTYGRGIWASASLLGINDEHANNATKLLKTNLKVYPNPVSDVTKLNFTLFKNTDVVVNIYSISGKLVKTIRERNVQKGDQTIDIDASDLTNGSYIIKFSAGTVNESIKFMKM